MQNQSYYHITFCIATLFTIAGPCKCAHGQDIFEGFTHPARTANVAAATSGIVDQWLVEEGESVKAGQPLIKLDDKIHQQVLAIAEAAAASRGELALAEAEQKLREQRLLAIEALSQQGHATPDELHRVQTEAKVAAARLMTAREHQLRHRLEFDKLTAQAEAYTVIAPFDGVVKHLHKHKGEFVGPVDPQVCELADLTAISAKFLVPQTSLNSVATGNIAKVHFPDANQTLEGKITLSAYPDAETGMRSVKVKIVNSQGLVKAGSPCQLMLNE